MKSLMRVKKILMYFRKNTADNLSLNGDLVELVNGDLDDVVGKLVEVQKDVRGNRRPRGRGSAY